MRARLSLPAWRWSGCTRPGMKSCWCSLSLTGLLVVGFTLLAEAASHGFERIRGLGAYGPYLALVWTPALTVAFLWWTRRFAPGAQGSGIPQVVRALDDEVNPVQQA